MPDRYESDDLPDPDYCFDHLDFQILELMGRGLPDSAIGNKLSLGHRTVQRRVHRMMEQTGATGRFALGIRINELGLLSSRQTDRRRPEEAPCRSH